jgi:hypothetical protein
MSANAGKQVSGQPFPLTEARQSLQLESERYSAMTLTIDLPDNLQAALSAHASAEGVSEAGYIRRMLERDLTISEAEQTTTNGGMTRSQIAGQRIRELRKGVTLGGISIKELIEEGRE